MGKVNILVGIVSIFWIGSEIILSIIKHAKIKSKDYDKSNSAIVWIINILSISIGINIAAANGIGSIRYGYPIIGYIGLILIIFGIVVRWIAIITLGRQFTTMLTIVEDHKIVDTGIYKYIRHPSYTGALISFFGLSISFSNWITFIIIFFPILFGYIYRITVEEKLLISHFGEKYVDYARKTRRLIPKVY